jgi:hypothetical protein
VQAFIGQVLASTSTSIMQKKRTRALRTEPGWIAFSLFSAVQILTA